MSVIKVLIPMLFFLLTSIIGVLCFVGKRFIGSVDKLVANVNDHETRITKLEVPQCEH